MNKSDGAKSKADGQSKSTTSQPPTSAAGSTSSNVRDFSPMFSTPGSSEEADILFQEIARLSEQQRRDAAARLLSVASSEQSAQVTSGHSSGSTSQVASTTTTVTTTSTLDLSARGLDLSRLAAQLAAAPILPPELAINTLEFHRNHDLSFPMMLQRDNNTSGLSMFAVGQHQIVGFIVGGEPRLCFPQLKAVIFTEINDLDSLLNTLQISTVSASTEQLNQLIRAKAIPRSMGVCSLITRSQTEKLLNYCLVSGIRPLNGMGNVDKFMDSERRRELEAEMLNVEHFCFGGQRGRYFPSLLGGACIECVDCDRLFEPPEFVRHTHLLDEPTSCDWGFDPSNWRFYIALHVDQPHSDEAEAQLRQLLASTTESAESENVAAETSASSSQLVPEAPTVATPPPGEADESTISSSA